MSPLWVALRPRESPSSATDAYGIALWALGFTPRVVLHEEAALAELAASVRLFGGVQALIDRIGREGASLNVATCGWAQTSLGALALARAEQLPQAGLDDDSADPVTLAAALDPLPFPYLTGAAEHQATLARLGCKRLADVRALPRGGISRRFGKGLLAALDQAYGHRPEVYEWLAIPDTFDQRFELEWRAETSDDLLPPARRLLMQLCGWLRARQNGVTEFTLHWAHDFMRRHEVGAAGSISVHTANATRDITHLDRLLAEHLAHTKLEAPVAELRLRSDRVEPMAHQTAALLSDGVRSAEPFHAALERVSVRLGPERVRRPVLQPDHRVEWMQTWQPVADPLPRTPQQAVDICQPTWVLDSPLKLAVRGDRPIYQGPLALIAGPHRVEGGWWHREASPEGEATHHVQRDYFVAASETAGILWIYRERLSGMDLAWYLHGVFA